MEVVLEMAHPVDPEDSSKINPEDVVDKLIFRPDDIVTMDAKDVDLGYATKGWYLQLATLVSKVLHTCKNQSMSLEKSSVLVFKRIGQPLLGMWLT